MAVISKGINFEELPFYLRLPGETDNEFCIRILFGHDLVNLVPKLKRHLKSLALLIAKGDLHVLGWIFRNMKNKDGELLFEHGNTVCLLLGLAINNPGLPASSLILEHFEGKV